MIYIKTPKQIHGIRKSCYLAADTLRYLKQFIEPGVSTNRLNDLADNYIRKKGGTPAPYQYKGFPKSICTSINEVICHGIPSDSAILSEGDLLKIDVATLLNGYYGDTCATFPVGKINDNARKLMSVARASLDIGIAQIKPKNFLNNIGYEINKFVVENGYSVVYQFAGHGVGLEFHEEPVVSHVARANTGPLLAPGMIFTVEPMINECSPDAVVNEQDGWTVTTSDKKLSAQFEHSVLVTETGSEILTKFL